MATRATPVLYMGTFIGSVFLATLLTTAPSATIAQAASTNVQTQRLGILRDGDLVGSHEVNWSSAVLGQDKELDTLNGRLNTVSFRELGGEVLRLRGSIRVATRYRRAGQSALDS